MSACADAIVPPFAFHGMFMAGAPVGDVPAHCPRGFHAGGKATNVKARASDPKGLALQSGRFRHSAGSDGRKDGYPFFGPAHRSSTWIILG